jgi:hypothetical protein
LEDHQDHPTNPNWWKKTWLKTVLMWLKQKTPHFWWSIPPIYGDFGDVLTTLHGITPEIGGLSIRILNRLPSQVRTAHRWRLVPLAVATRRSRCQVVHERPADHLEVLGCLGSLVYYR